MKQKSHFRNLPDVRSYLTLPYTKHCDHLASADIFAPFALRMCSYLLLAIATFHGHIQLFYKIQTSGISLLLIIGTVHSDSPRANSSARSLLDEAIRTEIS